MVTPEDLNIQVPDWREGQYTAIENTLNSQKRFVVHNAPVGSGKSIMLIGASRLSNLRTLILTGTRPLQNYYGQSFSNLDITDIKGKSNYKCIATEVGGEFHETGVAPKSVDHGPCQYGVECDLKASGCSYYDLIRQAKWAKLVLSNYAAQMSSNLYGEGFGYFPLVMCDEAHEAEGWLARTVSISLLLLYQEVIGITFPSSSDPMIWVEWAVKTLPQVKNGLQTLLEVNRTTRRGQKVSGIGALALRAAERLLLRLAKMSEDWIVIPEKDSILFHPVWVDRYAEGLLFCGAKRVVLASATIVPYELGLLGIKPEEYDYFEYPSTFPVENRPIYYYPVTKMHYGMDAEDNLSWISVVDDFISRRLDRKGIIHTVSFARQKQLLACSKHASLMVANSSSTTAQSTLQKYRMAPAPAILVTPSMATGTNLPYCVDATTKVLTADLRWIYAGDVRSGDTLAAFEEYGVGSRRRVWTAPATVEHCPVIKRPRYHLEFDDGTSIICSAEHRWLVWGTGVRRWVETRNLVDSQKFTTNPPSRLSRICDVWDSGHNYDSGYLAAAFDGEGHLYQGDKAISKRNAQQVTLGFAQKNNAMSAQVHEILNRHGYKFSVCINGKRGVEDDCYSTYLTRRADILRLLGSTRPARLLPKFRWDRLGSLHGSFITLAKKTALPVGDVVALGTSTHTFVAEGLASHNSDAEYAIICKVPFEPINDPVVQARLAEDPEYGMFQAAKHLLQMSGRIVRAPDDKGETLITDMMFSLYMNVYRSMLPKYFWDAVQTVNKQPEPLRAL